jgi:RNA polymerase sigma factor (sigma-70 family)
MEDSVAVSPEIYDVFASADWGTLGKKMLRRAIWRGSTRYRITSTTVFARGYSLEDTISYIIQSVLEGKRQWKPDEINLEDWLMNQIDSVIDWWLKLRENRNMAYDELENSNNEEDHEFNPVEISELEIVVLYGLPTPEATIELRQDDEEAKEIYNALFDAISDEPELQEVLLANMELSEEMDLDQIKPSNIAEKLGVTSGEVYNRNKRLKRRLDKVLIALGKGIS